MKCPKARGRRVDAMDAAIDKVSGFRSSEKNVSSDVQKAVVGEWSHRCFQLMKCPKGRGRLADAQGFF